MCRVIRFHSFRRYSCRIVIEHNGKLCVRCEDCTIRRTVDLCISERSTQSQDRSPHIGSRQYRF
jgi:hypothetical protein